MVAEKPSMAGEAVERETREPEAPAQIWKRRCLETRREMRSAVAAETRRCADIADAELIRICDDALKSEARAVSAERERCAKICDNADKSTHPAELADAIRAASPGGEREP